MTTLPTWRLRTLHEAAAGSRGNMPEGLEPHQVMATVAVGLAAAESRSAVRDRRLQDRSRAGLQHRSGQGSPAGAPEATVGSRTT